MASWKNVQYKNGQYRTSEGSGGSSTLSGLDDVTISSVSNGQVLKYNSTSSKWVNANDTSVTALEDLTDVDVDSKSDGDVLTYNEAQDRWEAAEPLGGGVTDVEVDGVSVVNDGVAAITTPNASEIEYDNQQSGLSATDVQSAIDELSQSTGVSTLSDLTDIAISSPTNSQVLTYDTTTSKWKNANATGGASTLNDLTDVDTTGVLDNNFLAYSQAQSKWVPATVSGGNVDDVQVNGTSVVTNKVAQIKSYKEVTLQQYQQLPSSKTSDGVLYCITDAGGADGFPPLIYSDEEREVGVWRDGKPLYQKTINGTTIVGGQTTNVAHSIQNIDKIIDSEIMCYFSSNGYYRKLNFVYNNGTPTDAWFGGYAINATNIIFQLGTTFANDLSSWYATIYYTKTTDVAGSGTWTTDGTYAHHCTTTEKVIGTWTDKKPLYERYFFINEFPNALSSNYFAQYNIKSIKYGYIHNWDGSIERIAYDFTFNTSTKAFSSTDAYWSDFIYLQYTKTTDD